MSVLIKGMKMPGNCGECAFCRAAIWKGKEYPCVCLARNIVVKPSETDMRDGLCPLIELPNHGDLIDRDALMAHKGSAYDIDGHELYAVGTGTILRMPVVIPAERSDE